MKLHHQIFLAIVLGAIFDSLTSVEGDTLVIKLKTNTGIRTDSPLVVTVDFTRLTHADLRGSGDRADERLGDGEGNMWGISVERAPIAFVNDMAFVQHHDAVGVIG